MSKPEKKVYLASQPFICKSNARIILSINHKAMDNIWETIKTEYKKDYGVDVPSYGVPTKYFLEKVHISRDDLIIALEAEKKLNAQFGDTTMSLIKRIHSFPMRIIA